MQNLRTRLSAKSKLKEVRDSKKWTVDSKEPLRRASKLLDPNWKYEDNWYPGVSHESWKFFLYGMRSIKADIFKAYCQVLELEWEDIAEPNKIQETAQPVARAASATPSASNRNFVGREEAIANSRQDWGEAPDVSVFYGRTDELNQLRQWIEIDRCRLIALSGMGGIGKTALSVKLAQQIQDKFEYVIWRSLQNTPPFPQTLAHLLSCFYQPQPSDSNTPESGISQLIDFLRQHRCLLVLDGVEALLQTGDLAGNYFPQHQTYQQLIQRIGETNHQSCLILTAREKLKQISAMAGPARPVRFFTLAGLTDEDAQELLKDKGLPEQKNWKYLLQRYSNNPLALQFVAATIQNVFEGNVDEFLRNSSIFIGDFSDILSEQFQRLSTLEKEILYGLALEQQSVKLSRWRNPLWLNVSNNDFIGAIESLERRSLLEKSTIFSQVHFSLQPVVMKFVTERLIEQLCQEALVRLRTQNIEVKSLFGSKLLLQFQETYQSDDKVANYRSLIIKFEEKLRRILIARNISAIDEKVSEFVSLFPQPCII